MSSTIAVMAVVTVAIIGGTLGAVLAAIIFAH